MALRFDQFSGIAPRVSERNLPANMSQTAVNANMTSGDIRAVRGPVLTIIPSGTAPWMSIFRAEHNGTEKWLSWGFDVDVAQVALSQDVEQRFVWTGDGAPLMTTYTNLPATYYLLGVPAPQVAPSVGHSGGVGSAVSRYYCYTFMSALNEESAPSPVSAFTTGKVDDTWAITGMSAVPSNSGAGAAVYSAPNTTFTNGASAPHWLRVGDEVIISGSTLTVLTIPTAASFTVAGDFHTATAWARRNNWNTAGMTRNLYRTSGTLGTFELVATGIAGTTYNDTLLDTQIPGDDLISSGWAPPPTGLRGISCLPNGALFGFVGRLLCISEPYQPHAWPVLNQYGTNADIVGAASYSTAIVVCTLGHPYIFDGVDPASMSGEQGGFVWPCLSKRSVVSIGDGVLYATRYGMAYLGVNGQIMWSQQSYTEEEWAPLNPSTMIAATANQRVYILYTPTNSVSRMIVFHPQERVPLYELAITSDELYADLKNGKLYYTDSGGVQEAFAAVGMFLTYDVWSKEIELPEPVNMGAAKVDFTSSLSAADATAAQAAFNAVVASRAAILAAKRRVGAYGTFTWAYLGIAMSETPAIPILADQLTFFYYAGGTLIFQREVIDGRGFTLPRGYKSDTLSVRVQGTPRIKVIKVAESLKALANV